MTAIAYRDGIMAADTQVGFPPSSGLKMYERKLMRIGGFVFGVSGGDAPSSQEIADWLFEDTQLLTNVPSFNRKGIRLKRSFSVLAASKYRVFTFNQKGAWDTWELSSFCAIGSGAEVCMGAMAMGATAEQAVAAAIKYADGCGGDVEAWEV